MATVRVAELLLLQERVPHIEHNKNGCQGNSNVPCKEWRIEPNSRIYRGFSAKRLPGLGLYTSHSEWEMRSRHLFYYQLLLPPLLSTTTSISVYVRGCNWKIFSVYVLSYFAPLTEIYVSGSTTKGMRKKFVALQIFNFSSFAVSCFHRSL